MADASQRKRLGWVVLGVLIGSLLTLLMPAQPLHAVATHGQDNFALATGLLDSNVEGVYFLDCLTGVLKGAALNVNNGQFNAVFETNVITDLKLDISKSPKFLMVTGLANLRHGPTQFQPGLAVLYIAEVNSGVLATYAVQYNVGRSTQQGPGVQYTAFKLLGTMQLRQVAVRPQ